MEVQNASKSVIVFDTVRLFIRCENNWLEEFKSVCGITSGLELQDFYEAGSHVKRVEDIDVSFRNFLKAKVLPQDAQESALD